VIRKTILSPSAIAYALLAMFMTFAPAYGQSAMDTEGVKNLLADKCGACHGNTPNPVVPDFHVSKLDGLAKTKYLVPGKPAESRIWQRIELDEMPPAHLQRQPLSAPEKESFRQWLVAYQPDARRLKTLTETLRGDSRLREVMQVAETAGVLDLLDNPGPFTVLAPRNDAFAPPQMSEQKRQQLMTNPGMAYDILLNHGVLGKFHARDMERLGQIQTGFGNHLSVQTDPLRIGDVQAVVIEADIQCDNGVIHIIDRLVSPFRDPFDEQVAAKISVTEFGVRMVQLDGGEFLMGSEAADGRPPAESPQRVVRVSPFLIGQHEITWSQYMNVVDANPAVGWIKDLPPAGMPVYDVSWTQAAIFCNRCSQIENLNQYYRILDDGENVMVEVRDIAANGYRLPTEAEWEYAARGGAVGDWFCAAGQLEQFAWFRSNTREPQLTGKKKPNEFYLYDVLGNVAEWCDDWYASYQKPQGAGALVNPRVLSPGTLGRKVYRGGSYIRDCNGCRLPWRGSAGLDFRHQGIGFRIARSPKRGKQ
jgi:formylglycine-generating enzyme required for sulfatase activity/uncharacterized surface protein with fasciclin (FAS1) repeats